MSRLNNRRYFFSYGLIIVLGISVMGCGKTNQQNGSELPLNSDISVSESGESNLAFPVEDYREEVREDLTAITECREYYNAEIELVREAEYQNIHFEECEFADFPETETIALLLGQSHGISVQESWETIENWLESIGKLEEIDMMMEVRVVSPALGLDENGDYYLFYQHMSELDSGDGAFIDNNKCHIQITSGGIYSMSDGKMTEFLKGTSTAASDALGIYSEDVIERGTFFDMAQKQYELIDGELTVEEGAQFVQEYFQAGTPFHFEEGVDDEIVEVGVFRLGDVHGYDYMMRRIYKGVPFAYMDYGNFHILGDILPDADIKHAYIVDDKGVTAFAGYNESERLVTLVSGEKIMGLEKMAEHLSRNLASQINVYVDSAGLVYYPTKTEDNPQERIIFPCWELRGVNVVKDEGIRLYVDVFTGDIYYYTFDLE